MNVLKLLKTYRMRKEYLIAVCFLLWTYLCPYLRCLCPAKRVVGD